MHAILLVKIFVTRYCIADCLILLKAPRWCHNPTSVCSFKHHSTWWINWISDRPDKSCMELGNKFGFGIAYCIFKHDPSCASFFASHLLSWPSPALWTIYCRGTQGNWSNGAWLPAATIELVSNAIFSTICLFSWLMNLALFPVSEVYSSIFFFVVFDYNISTWNNFYSETLDILNENACIKFLLDNLIKKCFGYFPSIICSTSFVLNADFSEPPKIICL